MEYAAWEPIYERIVGDFGFDPAADRRARDFLHDWVGVPDLDRFDFQDRSVAIAGGSDTLDSEMDAVRAADRVVAVSGAAAVVSEHGITPDLVVTDLDGTPATAVELAGAGVPVAVHAHGDNLPALRTWLPRFDRGAVLGTTQVEPTDRVLNVGGFTDGDRAAFLADYLGAGDLTFPGWRFDDPTVSAGKERKLEWAASLLHCLEGRRTESFAVLDGWRSSAETFPDGTPVEHSDGCSNG